MPAKMWQNWACANVTGVAGVEESQVLKSQTESRHTTGNFMLRGASKGIGKVRLHKNVDAKFLAALFKRAPADGNDPNE